ncbi:MAG: hypothetical protein R2780_11615 [Crocinitomicaceae bacterium]|nr:hypothetical protein [Crocinitomicaceae bacterium]
MIILSLTGLIRTLLIILGVLFLLQILGKMAQARRNIADQEQMKREHQASQKMANDAKQNYGKTTISKIDKNQISDTEYADYEEIE